MFGEYNICTFTLVSALIFSWYVEYNEAVVHSVEVFPFIRFDPHIGLLYEMPLYIFGRFTVRHTVKVDWVSVDFHTMFMYIYCQQLKIK